MLSITINKWEEYQPRKDLKSLTWFRLNSDIFDGQTYFKIKNDGLVVLLFVLSCAAKDNSATISVDLDFAQEKIKLKKDQILNILKKLEECQILRVSDQIRTDSHGFVSYITEQTIQTDITNKHNKTENFDFESAYFLYPLKKGKTDGLKKLAKEIKTQNDFDSFVKAVQNYSNEVKTNKTEPRFIKHFSTFCGCWRDWVDFVPTGKAGFENTRQDMIEDFNEELNKLRGEQ